MAMKPEKFYLISIVSCFSVMTGGFVAATQIAAAKLGYQSALGEPLFRFSKIAVYFPLDFFGWWWKFGRQAPKIFDFASVFIYVSVAAAIYLAIVIALKRAEATKNLSVYGTSHWATKEEIKGMKLCEDEGVVIGRDKETGEYFRDSGGQHILCMAPTGSGKGVGVIIPTLLTWQHSCFVIDIKSENFAITSGYRQKFLQNKIIKFEPTDTTGTATRWNPLSEIRLKTLSEVKDVQNVVEILLDPQGDGKMDPHWKATATSLLIGVIFHLKYLHGNISLGDVSRFLSNPEKSFGEVLSDMLTCSHIEPGDDTFERIYKIEGHQHPLVAQSAQEMLNKAEKELSSVLSTAMTALVIYKDPVIDYNTSFSEFNIDDAMNYEFPVSFYLVCAPESLVRANPLFRLLISMFLNRTTEQMGFEDGKPLASYKHKLLLLLDEFPALGKIEIMEKALAYIRGYGLKALLITQSINQLSKAYTVNNSIVDNCHVKIFYTANDESTRKLVSDNLGTKTEVYRTESYSGNRLNPFLPAMSSNSNQTSRPLMYPAEVGTMPKTEEIIIIAGEPPIKADKIRYYEDPAFTSRILPAAIPDKLHIEPPKPLRQEVKPIPTDFPDDGNDVEHYKEHEATEDTSTDEPEEQDTEEEEVLEIDNDDIF